MSGKTEEKAVRPRRLGLFFVLMTVLSMAANFVHPVTPTLIRDLGLHDYMFGVAFAMMMLTSFLFSPFWGRLNDRVPSGRLLLIGCWGYGLSQIFFAYSGTEAAIIAARLCAGAFSGGVFVNLLTYTVSASDAESRGRNLTIAATIQSVAGALGYLVGGLVGELSVRGTFLLQAALLMLCGVLFYFVCGGARTAGGGETPPGKLRGAGLSAALSEGRAALSASLAPLFGISVLLCFASTAFDQSFNYYLKAALSLGSAWNGLIKAAVALISLVANVTLCFWIIEKTDAARSLELVILAGAALSVLLLLPSGAGPFIALSVGLYACNSVSIPILQELIAGKAEAGRENLVMGLFNAAKSLGGIFGAGAAGFLYQLNARYPFICAAVILAAAGLLGMTALRRGRLTAGAGRP